VSTAVEIWIRTRGARRQAFYRRPGGAGWNSLPVPKADRALRAGLISIDGLVDAAVVPRETQPDPLAVRRAEFASEAIAINRAIESIATGSHA